MALIRDWVYVSFVAFLASLGAYLSGYSVGSMNGVQNFVGYLEYFELGNSSANSSCTETSHLSENARNILGTIISLVNLGGAVGSLIGGKPADYFGRKMTILMCGVLAALGTCIQGTAFQGAVWMAILGRFVEGFGHGLFFAAGPVYIAEIAPKYIRGALTSLSGLAMVLGILTSYITNLLLYDKPYGWRMSRLLACVFGLVYTVCMAFMPRTPRWLIWKGRESEARAVLQKTSPKSKGQEGIEEELEDIRSTLDPNASSSVLHGLKLLLKWKSLKRLFLGLPLCFFTTACGTGVFYYSEPLFCSLGIEPFVTSVIIGVLSLIGTIFTTIFVDKIGRKPLLAGGGLILSLLGATAGTLVYAFNLEEENDEVIGYIVVCIVCIFMLVYSASWFTVVFVVCSEIYPLEGRAISFGLSVTFNWLGAYTFAQAFPSILATLQSFGSLYLLSFINLFAALFVLLLVPETKGMSLEQMEKVFTKPWLERMGCSCCLRGSDCGSSTTPIKSSSGHVNGMIVTAENDVKLHGVIMRSSFIENSDKDWEDYWEQYEAEGNSLGKETTV